MQGKTTHTKLDAVDEVVQAAELPPTIMEYYKNVELSIDILHVNRKPLVPGNAFQEYSLLYHGRLRKHEDTNDGAHDRDCYMCVCRLGILCASNPCWYSIQGAIQLRESTSYDKPGIKRGTRSRNWAIHPGSKGPARCYYAILSEAEIYTFPCQMVIHLF